VQFNSFLARFSHLAGALAHFTQVDTLVINRVQDMPTKYSAVRASGSFPGGAQRQNNASRPLRGRKDGSGAGSAETGGTGAERVLAGPAPAAPATASTKKASEGQRGAAARWELQCFFVLFFLSGSGVTIL
jgi:hypothetical protein